MSELAQATGLTPEDIAAADLATAAVTSLQAESGETGLALGDGGLPRGGPGGAGGPAHRHRPPCPSSSGCSSCLRYYKGLTQDKTAKILGVSQVQVSRLEKKAIQFLRQELQED